jgi:hypothetical protein
LILRQTLPPYEVAMHKGNAPNNTRAPLHTPGQRQSPIHVRKGL